MRIVFDTNFILSALIFQESHLASFRKLWRTEHISPLVSRATIAELIRALSYPKFKLTADEQKELLADYLPYCVTITIPTPPPVTPPCRDQADTPFLQLALAGKADVLITGDKDLLALADSFDCRILTASEFLVEFGSSHD